MVTGQFNKDETRSCCEQLFGNWKSPAPYTRILGPYRKVDRVDRKIETPDKQNAMLIAGVLTQDVRRGSRLSRDGAGELHAAAARPARGSSSASARRKA